MDLVLLPLQGERRPRPLFPTPFSELNAEFSRDGRWLAYESNESGRNEIYVRPFPNVDAGRRQVSTNGGTQPLWARNGQELFYESKGALIRVPVKMGSTFEAGTPRKLFDGRISSIHRGVGTHVRCVGGRPTVSDGQGEQEHRRTPAVGSHHSGPKLVRGAEAPGAAEVTDG